MKDDKRLKRKVRNSYIVSTVSIMLVLFLLGVVCKTVRRAHAVVAVILGLLTIAWMSLSPLINEGSPFYRFHSPLHTYLTIVFGTTVIFLTGFLLTKFTKKEK